MTVQHHDLNRIANGVIDEIWSDSRLYVPVYRFDVRSEGDASLAADLPLMYIWNEIVENGMLKGFSFSLNGPIIGALLEKRIPRSHPEFIRVRDAIMSIIHESQNKVVMESCTKAQKPPSVLYGR